MSLHRIQVEQRQCAAATAAAEAAAALSTISNTFSATMKRGRVLAMGGLACLQSDTLIDFFSVVF